jgi:hypothetical protein
VHRAGLAVIVARVRRVKRRDQFGDRFAAAGGLDDLFDLSAGGRSRRASQQCSQRAQVGAEASQSVPLDLLAHDSSQWPVTAR